jgi:hypothetical protein
MNISNSYVKLPEDNISEVHGGTILTCNVSLSASPFLAKQGLIDRGFTLYQRPSGTLKQ